MISLIGKKAGMTRVFNSKNIFIPVTIIEIKNNIITSFRSKKKNGYNSTQITTGFRKNKFIKKPINGYYSKLGLKPGIGLWEIPYVKELHFKIGQSLSVDLFKNIDKIDVTGISKGKGFAGTIKRWNFKSQDKTHGNSLSHRVPGSIGQNQTPGRVFKGKKMSGHLGNVKITIQSLKIINIDIKNNFLIVKGAIPGYLGSIVLVKSSIK